MRNFPVSRCEGVKLLMNLLRAEVRRLADAGTLAARRWCLRSEATTTNLESASIGFFSCATNYLGRWNGSIRAVIRPFELSLTPCTIHMDDVLFWLPSQVHAIREVERFQPVENQDMLPCP